MTDNDFRHAVLQRLANIEAAIYTAVELQAIEGEVVRELLNEVITLVSDDAAVNLTTKLNEVISGKYPSFYHHHLNRIASEIETATGYLPAEPELSDDEGSATFQSILQIETEQ